MAYYASNLKVTNPAGGGTPELDEFECQVIDGFNKAYNEIIRCLSEKGYTTAQLATWAERRPMVKDLGFFYAARPRVMREDPTRAEWLADFRAEWDELCNGKVVLFDDDDTLIKPSPTSGGGQLAQPVFSNRDGLRGRNRHRVFGAHPEQFSRAPRVRRQAARDRSVSSPQDQSGISDDDSRFCDPRI